MYLIDRLEFLCKEYGRHQFTNPILAEKTAKEIAEVKATIEEVYLGKGRKQQTQYSEY